jgi:ABC-2 type transport system permease protein
VKTAWCIAKREIGAYFASPVAYLLLAAVVAISGLLFYNEFFVARQARMDQLFGKLPLVFLLLVPAMAMRLLAEEKRSGTIEVLLTMPVRDSEVVIGKLAAGLAVLVLSLVATLPYPIAVSRLGDLDLGPVIGGYIGALLLGSLYLTASMFASSLTRNQVIALVAGLLICFGVYALQWAVESGRASGAILLYMSPSFHYQNMTRGYFEFRSLVYFASASGLFVLLTIQALEARKWR